MESYGHLTGHYVLSVVSVGEKAVHVVLFLLHGVVTESLFDVINAATNT